MIPEENIKSGEITIYIDTPPETEAEVSAYNEHMKACKKALEKAKVYKDGILKIFAVCWVFSMVIGAFGIPFLTYVSKVFYNFWDYRICMMTLLILAAIYVFFGFVRDEIKVVTFAGTAFIIVNLYSVLFIAGILLLYVIYNHKIAPLMQEKEYPVFSLLVVRYEKTPMPRFEKEDRR